jgi:hypothetical protein
MKEVDARDVMRMRESMNVFFDELKNFVNSTGLSPVADSLAASERAGAAADQTLLNCLNDAYSQGQILFESAADHLTGFVRSLEEPVLTIMPWTCVRAVLETSAISAWLLDPDINAAERAVRSVTRRIEALVEQKKWAASMRAGFADQVSESDSPNDLLAHAESRLKHADGVAKNLGLDKRPTPKTATAMIRDELNEESSFRGLSAVTHGHHWALHQFGFEVIDGQSSGQESTRAQKQMKPMFVVFFGVVALKAFSFAVWRWSTLFGFDRRQLASIIDAFFDRFGAYANAPFWKSA